MKNIKDSENSNELVSLENQVKVVRLQDKLGKQNLHQDMKKVLKPVTKTIRDVSEEVTKTITETSIKNNQALENLSDILFEILNDRSILASCLMSPLSKITNPENTSQIKLVKDSSSNRVNDLLVNNTKAITLHNNLLTFRDKNKQIELKGDLLKKITNQNYNVDLASLRDKKLMYDFAKKMKFDTKPQGNKSTRDRTLINYLNHQV